MYGKLYLYYTKERRKMVGYIWAEKLDESAKWI